MSEELSIETKQRKIDNLLNKMVLDIGVLVDWPSVKCGQEFTDGLQQALPSLAEHGCSYREPGGFIRRLTEDEFLLILQRLVDLVAGQHPHRGDPKTVLTDAGNERKGQDERENDGGLSGAQGGLQFG